VLQQLQKSRFLFDEVGEGEERNGEWLVIDKKEDTMGNFPRSSQKMD